MSNTRSPPEDTGVSTPSRRPKRTTTIVIGLVGLGFVLWNVVGTELHVMRLRGAGFGDVVVASTRDHAYLPMIGAVLGAISSIGLVLAIKRLSRRPEK
ncbi:hypothetical protein [Pinisolibacter aquiterrae]|uniref:hypothetical protein n=1 Tax=Pinisolibacter aquiterrae TaxID=2815579 RepID=UPI001C3E6B17|nr:hypothetical protein [Pinisolibacter aquiterrae]MBV5262486.1 hypothetical protein [Pinisolibacter aquiterrae]MCC8235878.1 hypothetical protein [Pinisolibacter aquiterrae]